MDEIDFLKKIFKIITISFTVITSFMLFGIIRANAEKKIVLITLLICGGMYAITFLIYYILKIKFTNQFSLKYINNKDLNRDILKKYPPVIYSFLYNKKIESYTDYTATILNLECKKYLKVNDDGYDIIVLNDDLNDLYEHEKYVMNCIMKKEKFEMVDFNKKIILDLLQLDLICIKEDKKISILDNNYVQALLTVLIVLVVLFLIVTHLNIMINIFSYGFILGAIIYFCFIIFSMSSIIINDGDNTKYTLTKKGKDVRKNIFGLKRFLREYTLINDREIEYKELFENYIAYALSLGEAKAVEKFVSSNKKYRKLIYKREGEQI